MTKYLIYIYSNEKQQTYKYGYTSLNIKVNEINPYDTLSKRFKKVTHTIQYTPGGGYNSSEYSIEIYDPNAHYYRYYLRYVEPNTKLNSIEIYFPASDTNNQNPLVLGFNQENRHPVYYTAYFLYRYTRPFAYVYVQTALPNENKFYEKDLVTRLLQELNSLLKNRMEKNLVLRVDGKPGSHENKYPLTGHNNHKISISKSLYNKSYDQYEHNIEPGINTEFFYLSFDKNTLHIQRDGQYKNKIFKNITMYYSPSNSHSPVLIVFNFDSESRVYSHSDFIHDVEKNSGLTKKISELGKLLSEKDLSNTLNEKTEQISKEIQLKPGSGENKNISEDLKHIDENGMLKKITLKPKINSESQGNSQGPWLVYNDKIFTKSVDTEIDKNSLKEIHNCTFIAISAFYTSKNKPLLLEFTSKKGTTYYKRESVDGTSWKKEEFEPKSNEEIVEKLNQIVQKGKPELNEPVAGQETRTEQLKVTNPSEIPGTTVSEINLETALGIVGGVVVVILGGSGGGGYWWYKRRSVRNRILL